MINHESFVTPIGDYIEGATLRIRRAGSLCEYTLQLRSPGADGAFIWVSPIDVRMRYGDARELAAEVLMEGTKE